MDFIRGIFEAIGDFFKGIGSDLSAVYHSGNGLELTFTAIARWVLLLLAVFILLRSIITLIRSKNPAEVWAYMHMDDGTNIPITHWENAIGRGKSCDIIVNDSSVSRNHGTLVRDNDGKWTYMDLGSKNGAIVNGVQAKQYEPVEIEVGDEMLLGKTICTLFPVSLEEKRNNQKFRTQGTKLLSPWASFVALTIFQALTVVQLKFSLDDRFNMYIPISFLGMAVVMWAYALIMRSMKRKGFEMEIIAFFLSTMSLAVMSTCYPNSVLKQFISIIIGVFVFFVMCTMLRNLKNVVKMKWIIYILAILLLGANLVFAQTRFGASNWIQIGGITIQPSEIVKLAFIWVGAATMNELFVRKNSIIFTIFSLICFACLAKMGDFGTAIIFFVTFLVISFLRSGDFTKLIVIIGIAIVGGLMVLRFKSYVANRFAAWRHVWEYADSTGYQQTRTMSAASSGGLVGVGAGNGWLHNVAASETDLVFGTVAEEWGLIIAVLAIIAIVALAIFAYKSIWSGRSTHYTIAACAATTLFLFQTMLNVFGSVDILPLTGVTFPFLSGGGTSMIASWGLLAFIKAADTRQNASFAVSLKDKTLTSDSDYSVDRAYKMEQALREKKLEREMDQSLDYDVNTSGRVARHNRREGDR